VSPHRGPCTKSSATASLLELGDLLPVAHQLWRLFDGPRTSMHSSEAWLWSQNVRVKVSLKLLHRRSSGWVHRKPRSAHPDCAGLRRLNTVIECDSSPELLFEKAKARVGLMDQRRRKYLPLSRSEEKKILAPLAEVRSNRHLRRQSHLIQRSPHAQPPLQHHEFDQDARSLDCSRWFSVRPADLGAGAFLRDRSNSARSPRKSSM
jgi:hypothetical protein